MVIIRNSFCFRVFIYDVRSTLTYITAFIILLSSIGFPAFAQQMPRSSENNHAECHKNFIKLWGLAKNNDFASRQKIFTQMTRMQGPFLILPGPSHDDLTRQRQYILMSLYSIDSHVTPRDLEYLEGFYQQIKTLGPQSRFGQCMNNKPSESCLKFAVENNIIPSFEMFSEEIDSFVSAGYQAKCQG